MLDYKDVDIYLVLNPKTEEMNLRGVAHMIKLIAFVLPLAATFAQLIQNITLRLNVRRLKFVAQQCSLFSIPC